MRGLQDTFKCAYSCMGRTPTWMTKGRTVNFEGCYKRKPTKQLQAYNLSSSYLEVVNRNYFGRNIRVIDERNLLPEEQKGRRRMERGAKVDSRSPVH